VLGPYFNELMTNRQRLLWVATRRQLERWELLVAADMRAALGRGPALADADIWHAAIEHHFVLIAARNLVRALEDLAPPTGVVLDRAMRAELVGGRDLLEHWWRTCRCSTCAPALGCLPDPSDSPS
jgi:hypothetical protein